MSLLRRWGLPLLLLLPTLPACGSGDDVDTPCSALAACCSALSEGLAEQCQTAIGSSTLTQAECAEALDGYHQDGLCQAIASSDGGGGGSPAEAGTPDSGNAGMGIVPSEGLSCYQVTGSGDTQTCVSVTSPSASITCAQLTGLVTGSCPSDGLYGCCLQTMTDLGYTVTSAACYYGTLVGPSGESSCTGTWSTLAP